MEQRPAMWFNKAMPVVAGIASPILLQIFEYPPRISVIELNYLQRGISTWVCCITQI